MVAQVRGEPSAQQGFRGGVELSVPEHLTYCPNRFDERASDGTKVTAFTLDRDHAGHVGEQLGEESDVDSPFCQVERPMAQLVERQILIGFRHSRSLTVVTRGQLTQTLQPQRHNDEDERCRNRQGGGPQRGEAGLGLGARDHGEEYPGIEAADQGPRA